MSRGQGLGVSFRFRRRGDNLSIWGWTQWRARVPAPHRQPPFAQGASCHLYCWFAIRLTNRSGASTFHAQTYIPTQPAQAIEEARLSHAHEDPGRPEGASAPPRQGAQAGLGETRFPRVGLVRARAQPQGNTGSHRRHLSIVVPAGRLASSTRFLFFSFS